MRILCKFEQAAKGSCRIRRIFMAGHSAGQQVYSFKNSRLRQFFRNRLFQFFKKIAETDDAKAIWSTILKGQLAWRPELFLEGWPTTGFPYKDLRISQYATQPALRDDVIIITGRFRSGSTLLWNLFRNINGMTAYYEPFNERRWFDPHVRGARVDPTHKNVDEYWREYEGLEALAHLCSPFRSF
jgi:hypothetical protein